MQRTANRDGKEQAYRCHPGRLFQVGESVAEWNSRMWDLPKGCGMLKGEIECATKVLKRQTTMVLDGGVSSETGILFGRYEKTQWSSLRRWGEMGRGYFDVGGWKIFKKFASLRLSAGNASI